MARKGKERDLMKTSERVSFNYEKGKGILICVVGCGIIQATSNEGNAVYKMSLLNEFNKILAKDYSGDIFKADEITCFRSLLKAMGKYGYVYSKETHGAKGFVDHDMIEPHNPPTNRTCEIADLLIIYLSKNGDMRYTFMQNKRDKNNINIKKIRKYSMNPVQWDLLAHRAYLTNARKTLYPNDILSSAVLSSVGTYGIFTNQRTNLKEGHKYVDMTFFIAHEAKLYSKKKLSAKSSNRTFKIDASIYGNMDVGHRQILGLETLDEFEKYGSMMKIGTPIDFSDNNSRQIAQSLLSYANQCIKLDNSVESNINNIFQRLISSFSERYDMSLELIENRTMSVNLMVIEADDDYGVINNYK